MTKKNYGVAVVGLGAMGSAVIYHLARRGLRVLGLDRFAPPHALGSTHGESRIIREAYFEGPQYVPLVQRAYQLWQDLESESGESLFLQTGGLMIGPPDGQLVRGAVKSAEIHGLPFERLTSREVAQKFGSFKVPDEHLAVWEPRAGILRPERCVAAHLEKAQQYGAELHLNEPLCEWHAGEPLKLITHKATYRANRVIFTTGAWISELLSDLSLPLAIERQVLFWFAPAKNAGRFLPENFPIFLWEYGFEHFFYGFPDLGSGVKVAFHRHGEATTADGVEREVKAGEIEAMRSVLQRYLPEASGSLTASAVCLYTNTPDCHFLIDRHPRQPNVWIASPCSGHGFKFASAIGEALADLVTTGKTPHDLGSFGLARFSAVDRAR